MLVAVVWASCLSFGLHRQVFAFDLAAFPVSGTPQVEDAIRVFSAPVSDHVDTGQVRVAFYNIEMFTDGIKDGQSRTEEAAINQARGAARIIDVINPDVLFISEIENERTLNYLNDALNNPFSHGYVVLFGSGSGQIEKMNIGMLSRLKPVSVEEIDFGPLSGRGRPTRGYLRALFELDAKHSLLVYAVHLKANWGERHRNYAQRANAMKLLQEDVSHMLEAYPDREWEIMVIGDFNTDPALNEHTEDPTLQILEDWTDMWLEHEDIGDRHTVPTRRGDSRREFPPAIFDRILVHPTLREKPWSVGLPEVLMTGTDTNNVNTLPGHDDHISDHYPIYIDLKR